MSTNTSGQVLSGEGLKENWQAANRVAGQDSSRALSRSMTGRLFRRLAVYFCLLAGGPLLFLGILLTWTVHHHESAAAQRMEILQHAPIEKAETVYKSLWPQRRDPTRRPSQEKSHLNSSAPHTPKAADQHPPQQGIDSLDDLNTGVNRTSLTPEELGKEIDEDRLQMDRDLKSTTLTLLLLVLGLALAAAAALARGIVLPISRLVEGAHALAEGRPHTPLRLTTNDELQALAEAFNEMEASLQASQQRLEAVNDFLSVEKNQIQTILQCMPDGLLLLDPGGRIAMINPAARQMLRLRPGKAIGTLSRAGVPEAVAEVLGKPAQPGDYPAAVEPEFVPVLLPGDQEQRILRVTSAPVISEKDAWLGTVKLLRDVTREKHIEEMKSEFISIVSHELRTPLTSIRSFSEILLTYEVPDPQVQTEFLQIINEESERLTRLINDFLDIAKIESGQLQWRMSPLELGSLVQAISQTLSGQAERAGLSLEWEVDEEMGPVWGDPDRLQQVLLNLLGNAIKFTNTGSVKVRAHQVGSTAQVDVSDTGIGIDAVDIPHIFDRFYQVGNIVTDKPKGTGLGLAICKQIVERHGGRLWVESEPGRGSIFSFTLPLIDREFKVVE